MSQPLLAPMSVEEFYAWGELQEDRYEYVDGFPVPLHRDGARMMSGASRRHDRIVVNVLLALGTRLRGGPCEPFTADTAVRTSAQRRRRPDVGVECGERRDRDHSASNPRTVFEVLSPSTRTFDLFAKVDEYKALLGLREIVLIEPETAEARVWSRPDDGHWQGRDVEGLEGAIELPSLGVSLPMREVYDGLEFRPRPQAVAG